jgi:peptidoglycan/LPS O-acetylase OafA/YrhL
MTDKSTAGIPGSAAYRPDVDGLRGFGALLVLWFHFRETWNDSAYKGADLTNSTFFAVSGFVITLSVLRARARNPLPINLSNTAGFSLLFLCRRLQRLVMTQLFVTFITMAIFLATLVPGPQLMALVTTAQYSVIGGANVLFGTRGEETFYVEDETTDLSLFRNPLMHTWYLGVEEQVYLLYPWVFAAAHFCTERWHHSPYIVFGAVFLASLTCTLNVDRLSAAGFFLLQYRGWEVVLGVLTCHALVHSNALCNNGWRVLFWPQISFVLLESVAGWLFQYPEHSLTATICGLAGTAVFLISGHGYEWNSIYSFDHSTLDFRREVPLLNYLYGLAAPAYLGRISYSMYLWHFPVAVICAHFKADIQEAIGPNDAVAFSLQLILVIALSMFTHHMVENPFRWWKPGNSYLPALVVLLLVAGIEFWLRFISYEVLDVAESNFLRPHDEMLPPIFGTTHLMVVLATALVPALLFSPRPPKTFSDKSLVLWKAVPLGSVLLLLVYWIASCGTNIVPAPDISNLPLETTIPLAKNSSTFWNWRGGSHSFASFGCACRQGGGNARLPPGASNDPDLPLCFDSGHWGSEPHVGYNADARVQKVANKDCTKAIGLDWNADEIWKQCLEPGRPLPPSRRPPIAFVFGSSASQRQSVWQWQMPLVASFPCWGTR